MDDPLLSLMGCNLFPSAYSQASPTAGQPPPTTTQQEVDPRRGAVRIRDGFGPSIAASLVSGVAAVVGVPSFQEFRGNLIEELGEPLDPIARLLVDQLCWLHFRAAETLIASANTQLKPEQIGVVTAAAARLLAEFRKSTLALREYRAPARHSSNVTVVANNHAQVAVVDGKASVRPPEEKVIDNEIGSKHPAALTDEHSHPSLPQYQTRAGRSQKSRESRINHRTGAGPTAASCLTEPAVAESHRAEDDGRQGQGGS